MRRKFFCPVCDASCGLIAEVEQGVVTGVFPDKSHPVSKGYCCPKGLSLHHVSSDPDRILSPMKYQGNAWIEISWKRALDEISRGLKAVIKKFGPHSIATHMGTNGGHCFSHSMSWKGFCDAIGTRNVYNAGSVDDNNKFVAQFMLYGNSTIMPIPDLPNVDFLILAGTNPAHTNLSLAKCPNVMKYLKDIANRVGVAIIDPRRNETVMALQGASKNCMYYPIDPGTDCWLFGAMIKVILERNLIDERFIEKHCVGYEKLAAIVASCSLKTAARRTGIPASHIERLAVNFATTPRACIYTRLGTCITQYPTFNAWAVEVLHTITGHLDRQGCNIFGHAPFNVSKLGNLIGLGRFDQFRSRVGNHPSVMGSIPLAILAREMETPGTGQVKAFVESAGNVMLTAPNSDELGKAMANLDMFVSIDFYLNETAMHSAKEAGVPSCYVLPATTPLERENIHVTHLNYNIIPHVEYHDVIATPRGLAQPEWRIFTALTRKMGIPPHGNRIFGVLQWMLGLAHRELSPSFLVQLLSIIGNFMEGTPPLLSKNAITFNTIKKRKLLKWQRHQYGVLEDFLMTGDRKVHLVDERLLPFLLEFTKESSDVTRSLRNTKHSRGDFVDLTLIGRRHLKTMNSWFHNIPTLWNQPGKKGSYPFLLLHGEDALSIGVSDGDTVRVASAVGKIHVPVKISDGIKQGVACYPHGWGHGASGLSHARKLLGENVNKLTSSKDVEWISGMPQLGCTRVRVSKTDD
ncbi:molybdopterin-dependent oxidoreductase [Candidatus Bathyarchaeota archaeon]|nr:molybdopterin-dependent oxidoreductase [Candidatus Bathyarchaeota archaeon]